MMKGRLYIDGIDIYDEYGMYIVENGMNGLVAYPPLKPVEFNDWQEEDGIEVDLSAPVLDSREFSLRFAISGLFSRYDAFINLLSSKAYHEFNFTHIGRIFKLRFISEEQPNHNNKDLEFASLKFADDFPLYQYTYTAPASTVIKCDDFIIDGRPTTDYGIRFLEGCISEILKSCAVKQGLIRKNKTQAGALSDNAPLKFKSKDIKLNCLLRAESLSECWNNYLAFLHDLTLPGVRNLFISEYEHSLSCFYKSSSVKEFYPTDKIWLEFSITLTVIGNMRIDNSEALFASELNEFVNSEDEENAINVAPNKGIK